MYGNPTIELFGAKNVVLVHLDFKIVTIEYDFEVLLKRLKAVKKSGINKTKKLLALHLNTKKSQLIGPRVLPKELFSIKRNAAKRLFLSIFTDIEDAFT